MKPSNRGSISVALIQQVVVVFAENPAASNLHRDVVECVGDALYFQQRIAHGHLVIPPVCPHMSTPLSAGFFDGCILTCSKHLWQFSIEDGGTAVGMAEGPLLTYETKEIDGAVYVNVERELKYEHQCEGLD